jgi:purine nucleosidase
MGMRQVDGKGRVGGYSRPMVETVIIDCDPGVDDAVALLAAFGSPGIAVSAITTVAGNVPLERTSANARRICEAAGRSDVPVFAGCSRPMQLHDRKGAIAHGKDGLGGVGLPDPEMPLQDMPAVEYLIARLNRAPGRVTLAVLGPMTNVATALTVQPDLAGKIGRIVLMGGAAFCPGNMTPEAEFNFWFDPHAARIVMASGVPLVMLGLDVTRKVVLTPDRCARLARTGRQGRLAAAMLTAYAAVDPLLHDPCVIAYLVRPELFTAVRASCLVEVQAPERIGKSIVSLGGTGPGVEVVTDVAAEPVFDWLEETFSRLD